MKTLFAGFGGRFNSSKILLDHIQCQEKDKLCLVNSYKTSVHQLTEKLSSENYDYAVVFGQGGRALRATWRLETLAKKGRYEHRTSFPAHKLAHELAQRGYDVEISQFAGRWLCNNVYFYGLKFLEQTGQKCKMIFIHIPRHKKITNYAKLAQDLTKSLKDIEKGM